MTLRFDITWDTAPDSAASAWGKGLLFLGDDPLWYHDQDGHPAPIAWTWLELLEFLASRWGALLLEQSYPYDLVPRDPTALRAAASRRWEAYSRERRLREDLELHRFEGRHDLARALRGITLPSLLIVREGHQVWLCTSESAERADLDETIEDLRRIGDTIADHACTSSDPRAVAAVAAWKAREAIEPSRKLALLTGLAGDDLSAAASQLASWELDGTIELTRGDSELTAAARFLGAAASPADRATVLAAARAVPRRNTAALDVLTAEALNLLSAMQGDDPYEQGYALAEQVRTSRQLQGRADPEDLLRELQVELVSIELSSNVDAIGLWGPHHGPAILLNTLATRAGTPHGRRATLAHELGHLLADRHHALPLAEVLGGRTPYLPERRANAFSAEFLLPRRLAAQAYFKHGSLSPALDDLCETYTVGRILAAGQLNNEQDVANHLTAEDRRQVERLLRGPVQCLGS